MHANFAWLNFLKLLSSKLDAGEFNGKTPYYIMFGPDVCGAEQRVHVILQHEGEGRLIKEAISFPTDELTHIYTLIIDQPKQKFQVLLDGGSVASGDLIDNWNGLSKEPRKIFDKSLAKPEDWNNQKIDNPNFVADPSVALFTDIGYVGFELWQLKSGSIFDNILITDDVKLAKERIAKYFKALHESPGLLI
jgi:calreticulin